MFRMDRTKPWIVLGIVSYGILYIYVYTESYSIYFASDLLSLFLFEHPKVFLDVLEKEYREFILASSPIVIGFNPKWR